MAQCWTLVGMGAMDQKRLKTTTLGKKAFLNNNTIVNVIFIILISKLSARITYIHYNS